MDDDRARSWRRPGARLVPAGLVVIALGAFAAPLPRSVAYPIRTMGTYAQVTLVTADSAAGAREARRAHAALVRIDSLMTNWTSISEVARINRVAGRETTVLHPEVATVLELAIRVWRESDGAFDITVEPLVRLWGFLGGTRRVPSDEEIAAAFRHVGGRKLHFDPATRRLSFDDPLVRIDLGGIAKGYAVDVAAETLRAHGVRNGLVDLSGNMAAIGAAPGADGWRIGIRDPRDRMTHFARLRIRDGEAISTSGQYEQFVAANGKRYGHILDARTGVPADSLLSVTVVSRTALTSDAWDTPLFVLGPAHARRLARERDDLAVVIVQPGSGVDSVWVEEALRDRFVLEPKAQGLFQVVYF